MFVGMIIYISTFKAEVQSKLVRRTQLQPPLFTYSYGYSFLLLIASFLLCEIAGKATCLHYSYQYENKMQVDFLSES